MKMNPASEISHLKETEIRGAANLCSGVATCAGDKNGTRREILKRLERYYWY